MSVLSEEWQPEIAVSTLAFDGYSLEEAIVDLSEIGASSVELAYIDGYVEGFSEERFEEANAKRVRRILDSAGVPCSALSAHTDLSTPDGFEKVSRRIKFARMIGAHRVVTTAALSENKAMFDTIWDRMIRVVEDNEVHLFLENPGDGRTNVVNDGETAAEFMQRVTSPYVHINYDFGNLVSHLFERVRPEQDWQTVRHVADYFHIKDVDRDGVDWYFPQIGSGTIDYKSILREIAVDQRVPAIGIELPLRLRRRQDASPYRLENPLPRESIKQVISASLEFVIERLGLGQEMGRK